MQHISIEIKNSIEEAPKYTGGGFESATLEKAVIVRNGTQEGKSTVDLIFKGTDGKQHVVLITGRLIRAVATAIGDEG